MKDDGTTKKLRRKNTQQQVFFSVFLSFKWTNNGLELKK